MNSSHVIGTPVNAGPGHYRRERGWKVSQRRDASGGTIGAVVQWLRRRVRLRTRLRRLRQAYRRRFPQPLPAWTEPAAPAPPRPERPATRRVGSVVVVDPTAATPRGREGYQPGGPAGMLRLVTDPDGVRWEVHSDRIRVVAGRVGWPLSDRQAAVLGRLSSLTCPPAPDAPAGAWAEVVAQLAVTGVVLCLPADGVAAAARSGLAAELVDLLGQPLPAPRDDPMWWEIRSVRQRRAAMRHHLAGLAAPPTVSALLVTKRPQLLPAALTALAAQTYPELEIVVGVHGAPVPEHLPDPGRPLTVLSVAGERNLGEALAVATAAASGRLVTKVDDDDRYGPDHVWDLVLARHYSGATVVGKGAEFVYLAPKRLTIRRQMAAETGTDTVAGGTIALAPDTLAELGGWPAVPRSVDRALLDRVLAAGGTIYRTHPLGFIYTRHGDGHTWDPGLGYFLRDRVRSWPGLPPYPEFGTEPVRPAGSG